MSESLELDRGLMVVRSIGDTPGIVRGVFVDEDGGCLLAVDPGGEHPCKLISAREGIQCVDTATTFVALLDLVVRQFAAFTARVLVVGEYDALAHVAGGMSEFKTAASSWVGQAFTDADVRRGVEEFQALLALSTYAPGDEGCTCPACTADEQVTADNPTLAELGLPSLEDLRGEWPAPPPAPAARRRWWRR